jgi:hypothetical protein
MKLLLSFSMMLALATALIALLTGVLTSRYRNERVLKWHEIITDGHRSVPSWLVEDGQTVLGHIWKHAFDAGHMDQAIQVVTDTLLRYNQKQPIDAVEIMELAAGSGMAPALWNQALRGRNILLQVHTILTDLMPNIPAWKTLSMEYPGVSYINHPVDATNVTTTTATLNISTSSKEEEEQQEILARHRIRMIHFALHHFEPTIVQDIFRDVMKSQDSILIADLAPNMGGILWNGLVALQHSIQATPQLIREQPLLHLLVMPFMPFFIIPIMWHDATVSVLRSYSPRQLMNLIMEILQVEQYPKEYCFYTFNSVSYAEFIGISPLLLPFLNKPFLQFFWAFPDSTGECGPTRKELGKFVTQLESSFVKNRDFAAS